MSSFLLYLNTSRTNSPQNKNGPQWSRRVFVICGDGGNRTPVQRSDEKWSTCVGYFCWFRCLRFEINKIRKLPILKFRHTAKESPFAYPDDMTCPSAYQEYSGDTSLLKRKRKRSSLLQSMEKQLLCLCWHFQFDREIYELTILLGTHTVHTGLFV